MSSLWKIIRKRQGAFSSYILEGNWEVLVWSSKMLSRGKKCLENVKVFQDHQEKIDVRVEVTVTRSVQSSKIKPEFVVTDNAFEWCHTSNSDGKCQQSGESLRMESGREGNVVLRPETNGNFKYRGLGPHHGSIPWVCWLVNIQVPSRPVLAPLAPGSPEWVRQSKRNTGTLWKREASAFGRFFSPGHP